MTEIISSLIIGGLALIGVIVTNVSGNRKIQESVNSQVDKKIALIDQRISDQIDKQSSITDIKIEELTREVREHNNFAKRMPLVERDIQVANHRIKDLENKVEKGA